MARYRPVDTQPQFVAIALTPFDARYRNDTTGAPAYAPGMLLRVVLFAYSRGIMSSRAIAHACEEPVTFIALSGDSRPHFTTIAHCVSTVGDQIAPIFAAVLAIGDRQGLIGREMFAIDGVKLPSNASKHRSGTRADVERQAEKMACAAAVMLARHRADDALAVAPRLRAKDVVRRERLVQDAAELRAWLTRHPDDRRGAKGAVRKSNRTDTESAKMATSKGVIQGYTGEANLRAPAEAHVPALIADGNMRKRDTRFATQERYTTLPNPLHDKSRPMKKRVVGRTARICCALGDPYTGILREIRYLPPRAPTLAR